jgi:hypothetical protein
VPAGHAEIWLTESTLGGGGVLEEIARQYAENPRRFFRMVESALDASDFELVDAELTRIVTMSQEDPGVTWLLTDVRSATRHEDLQAAVSRLEAGLSKRGVLVTHSVMSAVHARILRPGSSDGTDALLLALIKRWRDEESRLGIELDSRIFAFLASADTALVDALKHVDPNVSNDRAFRFHALSGLLWPRGNAIRSLGLGSYNPFSPLPPPDRELVLDRLTRSSPGIGVETSGWRAAVAAALRKHGIARLTASLNEYEALKAALLGLAVDPLEFDALLLYPQVESIERGPNGFRVTLNLPEAIQ